MIFIFSIIILLLAIGFIRRKQYNFFVGTVVIYIFYLAFLYIEKIYNFQVKSYITLLVQLTFLGHLLLGEYFNFYNTTKHYDRYLHALGSFSFSLFSYSILFEIFLPINSSKIYACIFVASMGISLGVFLEILEFILDTIGKKHNQKGLVDTDFDLIFNVIGAIIASIFYFFIIL